MNAIEVNKNYIRLTISSINRQNFEDSGKILAGFLTEFYQGVPGVTLSGHTKISVDLIFIASICGKLIFVPYTNYITSAIRKFMLDIPIPGSFQNKGL